MQGKNGAGSEGENGNIMLLLDAAQELHRSSSDDEGADIEPSTAGTGAPALPRSVHPACFTQQTHAQQLQTAHATLIPAPIPLMASARCIPSSLAGLKSLVDSCAC